jgi:Pro-kumamolisin, activation domain
MRLNFQRLWVLAGCVALAFSAASQEARAASSRVTVATGALTGLHLDGPANPATLLHIAIELQPRGDLEGLAAKMSDPQSPLHRKALTREAFIEQFGRLPDLRALNALLKANAVSDVATAGDGLVGGGIMRVAQAEHLFGARWQKWTDGARTVLAPAGPLTVPIAGVRRVGGAVVATAPRLADTRPSFTFFRGDWYEPARFRSMTDAIADGGGGQRVVVVEDASDRFDLNDIKKFLAPGDAPPPGASASRVSERAFAFKSPSTDCGRDDRGQEPALDVAAVLTMAPLAEMIADYDDVCSGGNDGTLALARALDLDPTVIVFPFAVGPVDTTIVARYGLTPIPILEALVRGIPLVVPAGDDGAYGFREPGIDRPRVSWPCVSPYVICAGGTQLGDRDGLADEGPWNDDDHAGGGGISSEPRPAWQDAPSDFIFSTAYVHNRMVPDVSADASGHLRVYWHGYGLGGVGGTSESASLVGAELAAINSMVGPNRRLLTAGDLYALAKAAPTAFRDITLENDRGWKDNTLRPRRKALPKNFRGVIPPAPPLVRGCTDQQPDGCTVRPGYDAVTGIGSLKEKAAVDALR